MWAAGGFSPASTHGCEARLGRRRRESAGVRFSSQAQNRGLGYPIRGASGRHS